MDNNILPFDVADVVDGIVVVTELLGVSKILEAAETRADDEVVASEREFFPFCKIFDRVPFDVLIVGLLCITVKEHINGLLHKT